MPRDAVADGTEARQLNEKPLFEKRWKWAIEVSGFRKGPEFFGDFWNFGREAKKVWKNAESVLDAPR